MFARDKSILSDDLSVASVNGDSTGSHWIERPPFFLLFSLAELSSPSPPPPTNIPQPAPVQRPHREDQREQAGGRAMGRVERALPLPTAARYDRAEISRARTRKPELFRGPSSKGIARYHRSIIIDFQFARVLPLARTLSLSLVARRTFSWPAGAHYEIIHPMTLRGATATTTATAAEASEASSSERDFR